MKSLKAIFRRQQKEQSHQNDEDLSPCSSVTNMASSPSSSAASTPAKKATELRKVFAQDLEADLEHQQEPQLKKQQKRLEDEVIILREERSTLVKQLLDQKSKLMQLEADVKQLNGLQEQSTKQIEQITAENAALRNRLRDVVHSPLSDNEKHELLMMNNERPLSQTQSINEEANVACLQDRINRMEETHYSTSEELQATLHELAELQKQCGDLQQDNERLADDKNLMFDSLCRQTERLKESRDECEQLKVQMLQIHKQRDQNESVKYVEREGKLVQMLESEKEKCENLKSDKERLSSEVEHLKSVGIRLQKETGVFEDRARALASALEGARAEVRHSEKELIRCKDQCKNREIEIERLVDAFELAKGRILEMEQDRLMADKSEAEELLDNSRKEKELLEVEMADLKEEKARLKNEIDRLKDQVASLEEEKKVLRNNAKCAQEEWNYKTEVLIGEKAALEKQLKAIANDLQELQMENQCLLDDKQQLSSVLTEMQRNLSEMEERLLTVQRQFDDLNKKRNSELEEWEKFQNDLLTSVRVANEFKTEAQEEVQKLVMENKSYRERIRSLEQQVDKQGQAVQENGNGFHQRPSTFPTSGAVDVELTTKRQQRGLMLSRQSSRQSVKSLIESIENISGRNPSKIECCSPSNSTSSINSIDSDDKQKLLSPVLLTPSPKSPPSSLDYWSSTTNSLVDNNKSSSAPVVVLREHNNQRTTAAATNKFISENISGKESQSEFGTNNGKQTSFEYSRRNSYSDQLGSTGGGGERKDPLNSLVKNGGSKRNALLKWCQNKTVGYRNIDVTNFSSSWNDGLAFCALLHSYLPDRVPYDTLKAQEKRRNFSVAFQAAESVGIPTTLNINEMIQQERPDWQQIMGYVTAIYKHFES